MFLNDSDKTWEYFGKTDPYFGVLTQDGYRTGTLTGEAKRVFFDSGKSYVDFALGQVREHLDASFQPTAGLDFGCGVGRLTIPLARVCRSIVGVDVSESMLAEAAMNSREHGVFNATFVKGDDGLSNVSGPLDFVHSFIVFQHIPMKRGEAILERLIDLLQEDGVGVLHFTCSWSSKTSTMRRLLTEAYRSVPLTFALRNLLKGRPANEPLMQMNRYDLNRLLRILHETGCHRVHVRFTETGYYGNPFYGVILFFQKHREDVRAYG
ncbi:MAG: class I SAM-dependent methyltransferase [Polyangiaceae bacterium]|jgi:trans-aconitate methyltransferase